MTANVYVNDERTLDLARKVLLDMGELAHASYRIGYLQASKERGGLPSLVVQFDHPEIKEAQATKALAIVLVHLSTGNPLSDDRLKRAIRNGVEKYLHAAGLPRYSDYQPVCAPTTVLRYPASRGPLIT